MNKILKKYLPKFKTRKEYQRYKYYKGVKTTAVNFNDMKRILEAYYPIVYDTKKDKFSISK